MKNQSNIRDVQLKIALNTALLLTILFVNTRTISAQTSRRNSPPRKIPSPSSEIDLSNIPFKFVYESYRNTEGKENWEIIMNDVNDSNQVNLTRTPDLDEMYPHVSPDGTKICFVIDEGTTRRNKVRSVYFMNIDGTNRVEVARNARQPCWSPDGKKIAFLRGEYETYNQSEYATAGLVIYDLETRTYRPHPNQFLNHIYAICWSPDGNWFLGVVKGNSEYSDAILAIEANGPGVFNLGAGLQQRRQAYHMGRNRLGFMCRRF